MRQKMKYVRQLTVIDPDAGEQVEVAIYKLETGGIVGIDARFFKTGEPLYSPYDLGVELEEVEGNISTRMHRDL